MTGTLGIVALALLWTAVVYRTWRLPRGPRSPQRVALWLNIVALAMAATVFYPSVYRALDRAAGVPNLAELVGHSLILVAAWQAHSILIFLIYERSAAWRRTWVGGALVAVATTAMAVFFGLAPVDQEAPQMFTATYAGAPYIVPYWVTFLFAVNLLLGDMVRLVARYANRSPREHLRLGLHLITVGGSFAVAYWCYWSAYLVLRLAERLVPSGLSTAGRICMFVALAFCVLGSTVPAVGPRLRLPTPYSWLASLRDYRQLYPLWRELAAAAPEIVLNQPPRFPVDVRFWLNRRIIEIEDGLRLFRRSPAQAQESDLGSSQQSMVYGDPATEAELIRRALTDGRHDAVAATPINETTEETESSYADRLRWHLDVARAFANPGRGGTRPLAVPDAPLRKEVDSAT